MTLPLKRKSLYKQLYLAFHTRALKSWDNTFIKSGLANGAEVDLKIEEDFKEEDLVTFLKRYAEGKEIGGNILTSKRLIKKRKSELQSFSGK